MELQQLSDIKTLLENKKLPMGPYRDLDAFKRMEQEQELIQKIETYHLPEITKLICGSDILLKQAWAKKYKKISTLCNRKRKIDSKKIFERYADKIDEFEKELLAFEYPPITNELKGYYEKIQNDCKKKKRERWNIQNKIRSAESERNENANHELKKENENINHESKREDKNINHESKREDKNINHESKKENANVNQESKKENANVNQESKKENKKEVHSLNRDAIKEDKEKVNMLCKEIESLKEDMIRYKKHYEKICDYSNSCRDKKKQHTRREQVYDYIVSREAQRFIEQYKKTATLTETMKEQLKESEFRKKMLVCLEGKTEAFPILVSLYEESAIDMESSECMHFAKNNQELLCKYLLDKYEENPNILENSEIGVLFEMAIRFTFALKSEEKNIFDPLWNAVTDESQWKWILDEVCRLNLGNPARIISCLEENVLSIVAKVLDTWENSKSKFSVEDICLALLKFPQSQKHDIVIEILQSENTKIKEENKKIKRENARLEEENTKIKEENKKIEKKLFRREKELSSQGQELFQELYTPIEELEGLAINLKFSSGKIKCGLVANQLIEPLSELREGLIDFGLSTLEEIEAWKGQKRVKFNPEKHKTISRSQMENKFVVLKTLGFAYIDSDGKWKTRVAEVFEDCDEEGKNEKEEVEEIIEQVEEEKSKEPSKRTEKGKLKEPIKQTEKGKTKESSKQTEKEKVKEPTD